MPPFPPCIPTAGKSVPSRPEWFHEIKYDGYRLILVREDKRFTRNGHDWSGRFPWIVESALKNPQKHFVIDGEAVILGVDGVSDFNALHSRQHDEEVQLYAFDCMALDGEDLRGVPLSSARPTWRDYWHAGQMVYSLRRMKPAKSARTYSAKPATSASRGLVSKRADRRYRAGRSPDWVRKHPAMYRVAEAL